MITVRQTAALVEVEYAGEVVAMSFDLFSALWQSHTADIDTTWVYAMGAARTPLTYPIAKPIPKTRPAPPVTSQPPVPAPQAPVTVVSQPPAPQRPVTVVRSSGLPLTPEPPTIGR